MANETFQSKDKNFVIEVGAGGVDVSAVHEYLCHKSYWAAGIPMDVVERSIDHSLNFNLKTLENSQIGFARVVSDSATFAYLADVYVLDEYRGRGLGQWLVEVAVNHTSLKNIRRWILATSDMHRLYAKNGFKELSQPEIFMEKVMEDPYSAK